MTGGRDFMMEFVTFVGGSVGLPDALGAYRVCGDHPMMWLLNIIVPGTNEPSVMCEQM